MKWFQIFMESLMITLTFVCSIAGVVVPICQCLRHDDLRWLLLYIFTIPFVAATIKYMNGDQ